LQRREMRCCNEWIVGLAVRVHSFCPMGPFPVVLCFLVGAADPPTSSTPNPSYNELAPLTGSGRVAWAVKNTIGPSSLLAGALQAGYGLKYNHPEEYGQGMLGYGKRFGLRLSSIGTSNVMEASLGALWHEDPRYRRSHEESTGGRFRHALKMTLMAEKSDGSLTPAYARLIAYTGSNAISDAWRPDSQRTVGDTMGRIMDRYEGRLLGNLWIEFWPSLKQRIFRK
jgi:hypothetical protein